MPKNYLGVYKSGKGRVFSTGKTVTKARFPFYAKVFGPFGERKDAEKHAGKRKISLKRNVYQRKKKKQGRTLRERVDKSFRSEELLRRMRALERRFGGKSVVRRPSGLRRRFAGRSNPPTEIYDRIMAIEAQKGNRGVFPGEQFRHDFKRGTIVEGMPDGSLRIRSRGRKKRLWKSFNY